MSYITHEQRIKEIERLKSTLEFALEMQEAVEQARAHCEGSPECTIAWMSLARVVLANPYIRA